MKRNLKVATGVMALCGGIFLVSGLMAQQAQPQPVAGAPAAPVQQPTARPTTRIALINLSMVVKGYNKFKAFQDEMKGQLKVYEEKDKGLAAQIEALAKQMGDPATPPANKDMLEHQAKNLQRQREDNSNDAKAVLSKKSDEQMVILYKEVQEAAQRTAVAHGFELVLHYNDAITAQDYWSPPNIMRKMQAGACMPLYAMPGMDISQAVLDTMNASYHPVAAPQATGGAPQQQQQPQPAPVPHQ